MATQPPQSSQARLNPFIFPSDTTFRFALLIATIFGASLFIYLILFAFFNANYVSEQFKVVTKCSAAFNVAISNNANPSLDFLHAQDQLLLLCYLPGMIKQVEAVFSGIVLLFVIATAIFLVTPAWKIWREHWEPLKDLKTGNRAEIERHLVELCQTAGLKRRPTFLQNMAAQGDPIAFGNPLRYYVALSGPLIYQFDVNRPLFHATILHELAHLSNADVNKTYFTKAVWQAFVIAALLPSLPLFILASIFGSPHLTFINITLRILFLTLLVYLNRYAVLRSRETYADIRASSNSTWREILEAQKGQNLSPRAIWRRLLAVHPTLDERLGGVNDPSRLFELDFWIALGTGLAAGIAIPNLINVIPIPAISQPLAGLLFAPLLVGIVGSGVWRATFARMVQGRPLPPVKWLSLGSGLGMLLGQGLSFFSGSTGPGHPGLIPFIGIFSFDVPWIILFTVSIFFFLHWMVDSASSWQEIAASSSSPRAIYRGSFIMATILLCLWFLVLFFIHGAGQDLQHPLNLLDFSSLLSALSTIILASYIQPLTLLIFMILWAYPLAAWFWRKHPTGDISTSWMFLDAPAQPLTRPPQSPIRPGLSLKAGLAGGLAFLAIEVLMLFELRFTVPHAVRNTYYFAGLSFYMLILLAILTQVAVGIFVTTQARRLPIPHALFASFIAGCITTLSIVGVNAIAGGTSNALLIWTTLSIAINGGAFFTLFFSLLATALVSLIWYNLQSTQGAQSQYQSEPPTNLPQPTRPRRKLALLIGMLIFLVLLISLCGTTTLALLGRVP